MSPLSIDGLMIHTSCDIVMSDMGVGNGMIVGFTTNQDASSNRLIVKDFLHDSEPRQTGLTHQIVLGNRGRQDGLVIHDELLMELMLNWLMLNWLKLLRERIHVIEVHG